MRRLVLTALAAYIFVSAQPLWAISCRDASTPQNRKIQLGYTDLESAYELGALLFLNSDTAEFANVQRVIALGRSSSTQVIEANDINGRTFVFKKHTLVATAQKEYRLLRVLREGGDELAPEPYILRIGDDVYTGTEKIEGMNVKEIFGCGSWRQVSTKSSIEGMLHRKFVSANDAVASMASVLLNHPDFDGKIRKIERRLSSLGVSPSDFQFMFFINLKTNHLNIKIIDTAAYDLPFHDGSSALSPIQGVDYMRRQLRAAAAWEFGP